MAGSGQPRRSDQPSIKYRCNPLEGAFFELAGFDQEDYAPTPSDNSKQSNRSSEPKSSEILSTAELISSVGQIWDFASRSLAVLQHKTNLKHNNGEFQKGGILCYPSGQGNGRAAASSEGQYLSVDLITSSYSSPMAIANLECPKVTQKMSIFETCSGNHMHSLFWRFLQGGCDMANESWKEKGLASVGISYDLVNIYGWMRETTVPGLKHLVSSTQIKNVKPGESCILGDSSSHSSHVSGNVTSPAHDLIAESANNHAERTKCIDSSSGGNANSVMNMSSSVSSLYSDYFLGPVQDTEVNDSVSSTLSSRLHTDNHVTSLASGSRAFGDCQHKTEDVDLNENERSRQKEFVVEDRPKLEIFSSTQDKPHVALAKQEHAFAGAFAGVFVSLCLHPVDTIKTVIQSCRADQKSIHYIGRSIISERGVTGLYRGIASNIASSAPISAVYTFTYESVKGALLPLFPKEYHSFAHCMAGGCASIATSFIFTPSERIKQQMQVRSHYQNCWKALVGIIEKGGLPSLYAGWGAVLCRNVPHSIIKFYTYESLKQFMLSSLQPNAQPNTLQTLVCGGLAGSTAALFTTPFDVVKTRLQTQIPGSVNQYDGVFKILKEIGKREGLRGLYRGLSPRLVMYMTQGALFFASYETFKRLSNVKPDHFTYPCVLKACAGLNASIEGILIHTQITKSGFDHNVVVTNSLIDMYSKVGSLGSARGIFDEMPKRNLVSWNCMISGYALNGFPCAALGLCSLMKFEGMELDKVTLKIVLPACGLLRAIQVGEQLHAHVIVLGFASDTMIVTAVMDMYAKCGIIDAAEKLFDEILYKDAITWNAMISGYSRKGQLEMVLKFFCKMVAESVEPTAVTMLLSLQACADLPSLQTGETIHGSLVKNGLSSRVSVEALLINMYSKCGRLDLACRAFLTITEESVNSWSAIIHGLGMHGYGEAALMSFIKMLKRGINPDGVCFLVVLSSCSHTGMLSEGYKVFEYMVRHFGLVPKMEHYVTMVDLIGRAGFIDEAFQFIGRMPIEPDISIWGAFFGACKIYGKFDIGISTERLVELDPKTAGYYKLLVNTYASKGRWDEVHQVRRLISEKRVQRAIGYSLLVVEGLAS
ncbi:hypothetical protein F0562_013230 [Nyssa sinensis]|uniref:Uncharacterized protein n=1 Tax=Nyssa sinensis TaxID=561372 RepID=A0A5J4ZWD5_9ASTE|nr:hypothetical protein F0562_013230 [Nyssa sinensis]